MSCIKRAYILVQIYGCFGCRLVGFLPKPKHLFLVDSETSKMHTFYANLKLYRRSTASKAGTATETTT